MAGQRKIEEQSTSSFEDVEAPTQRKDRAPAPASVFDEDFFSRSPKPPKSLSFKEASRATAPSAEQQFVNYGKLVDRVMDVFGDDIAASKWLSTPSADFDQKTPLEAARVDGYQTTVLEPVLIRIEHGIYF